MFKKSRNKQFLRTANFMALRPVAKHRHEVNEDGLATVFIPKFKNRYLIKFLVPSWKSPEFRIKLDELGSAVWLSIDGKKNVDSICLELINKLGEKVHPAEDRVTKFLSTLYYQGFISFRELEELDEQRQF